jgi:NAD(P)-dependent dehydrogenase (short-subunit alcohol dehydrogenase family)
MADILVTGCSSGFGKLIARTMGRCGYRVYAGMRSIHDRNADAARELSDWAVAQNAAIDILELDVDSEESVNGAVCAIGDAGGKIEVVVNNAAITAWGPTEAFDFEQLASVYNTKRSATSALCCGSHLHRGCGRVQRGLREDAQPFDCSAGAPGSGYPVGVSCRGRFELPGAAHGAGLRCRSRPRASKRASVTCWATDTGGRSGVTMAVRYTK